MIPRPLPEISEEGRARFRQYFTPGATDECWEWQGATVSGYGRFAYERRSLGAHRVSYEIHKGPIPAGLVIRHTCDYPRCVNPSHLLVGTYADNQQDAMDRNRLARGDTHGGAKLTVDDVSDIRISWRNGETQVSLARRLGVSRAAIQWVINGRTWSGLGEVA